MILVTNLAESPATAIRDFMDQQTIQLVSLNLGPAREKIVELIQLKSVGRRAYDWRSMESGDVVGMVWMLKCDATKV